jgi:hypothetical protein
MVAKVGGDAVLLPAGFVRGRGMNWIRREAELSHVINLSAPRGTYFVQWGVLAEGAAPIVWGHADRPDDVADALMAGTPSSIRHPAACSGFRLNDVNEREEVQRTAAALALDMGVVAERLRSFHTRRDLRLYLMSNRQRTDRRDFVIPAKLPLKLFHAATLAVLDGAPEAADLVAEAMSEMSSSDDTAQSRGERLQAALATWNN